MAIICTRGTRSLWLDSVVLAQKLAAAPKMYPVKDKTPQRLDPSSSTQWFGNTDSWASNITFPGLVTLSQATIQLDPTGSVLPIG